MKKLIYILFLLPFFAIGQVSNGTEFEQEAFRATNNQTVTTSDFITTTGTDGTQGKILGENISLSVIPPVHHFTPLTPNIKGYFQGVDDALGDIVATTAGITTRLWLTADQTIITAGTFYRTNFINKGVIASAIQSVTNNDNEKKYFAQDIIGDAYVAITTFPKGVYAGNLSVSTSPNSARQKFTVEVYKCNNDGTPIASGISGAVTGDLGVTVITILDSGELTLADGSVTNVPVSNTIELPFTINVGERVRYHISAEKVGTTGANITESLYLGTSYNSYIDVPVPLNTSAVQNLSTVAGATTTEVLNNLDASVVHKTGNLTESIDGDKTFLSDVNIKGSYIRVAGAFPNISGVLPLYLGDTPNTDRSATFYVNKPAVLGAGTSIGWHSIGSYSSITQTSTDAAHATFDSRDVLSGAGIWDHFIGFQSRPVFSGVGISTYMAGFAAILSHNGSGTINEGIGLRVNVFSGAGTFTNKYGVYIENLGLGANDYSIYTGTSKSYFGGNTGFGTTLPGSRVSIKDGASGEQLSFERGTGKVRVIQTNNADDLFFYNSTATIPYFSMKYTGNIGFGTTTPNYNAHINSSTTGSFLQLTSTDTGTSTTDGVLIGTGTGGNVQITNRENTPLIFSTNNSESYRILANGRVLIGKTNPDTGEHLQVNGNIAASAATSANQVVIKSQLDAAVRPYKVLSVLFTQTSTNNPVVTILENTLGTVTFTYSSVGVYLASSSALFTTNKTFVLMNSGVNGAYINGVNLSNTSQFFINTKNITTAASANDGNNSTALEIRVYP